ncbi:MAG TPA: SpoIIE family protein phosphatase [Candidatus Angelobacter sp.]|jgi:serine phosphatase RsbU (regulator of sigma subunit)|nr:SpoIIE family protein phosphatase [Candidatus Angelobacter sp.]
MEKIKGLPLDCGIAAQTLPGQNESGDKYVIIQSSAEALVAVIDGLGHGEDAASAARIAAEALQENAGLPVIPLLRICHQKLRDTRGVVMSIATFNPMESTVSWLGVGNVEGVLLHRDSYGTVSRELLSLRGGVVGDQLPNLITSILPVSRGDTLVFATDGVRNDFVDGITVGDPVQRTAENILAHHARGTDDALVLVVRYSGLQKEAARGGITE